MTVYDLCCDRCGVPLSGPEGASGGALTGVRVQYHPGLPELGDDAGLVCKRCWEQIIGWMGARRPASCSVCEADLRVAPSLFVYHHGDLLAWRLCRDDALEFLNGLRTVEPKLDPDTFQLPRLPPPSTNVSIHR